MPELFAVVDEADGVLLKLNVVVELVLDGGMGPFRFVVDVVVDEASELLDSASSTVVGNGLVRHVGVFGLLVLAFLIVASALFMSS